jgi:hypothetical protein
MGRRLVVPMGRRRVVPMGQGVQQCWADGTEAGRDVPGFGVGRDEGGGRAGIGRTCILSSALGCSILIDFSILGYFCQLEFIHPSHIAICRIEGSRHSTDCKTIISCLFPF